MVITALVAFSACAHDSKTSLGSDAGSSSTTVSAASPSPVTGSTGSANDPAGAFAGLSYKQLVQRGYEAHQRSDFGTKGSWTLFTVEKDGHWYSFTASNKYGSDGTGHLEDSSQILSGASLAPLQQGDWYGVEGVVRYGQPIGGVMMQGHGYEREHDGTFPVVAAWHVNLQTLNLDPTSTAGLDITESCG